MNTPQHLIKFLNKHHATLSIDTSSTEPELFLSLPERRNEKGQVMEYATIYRLGKKFPPDEEEQPEQPDLLNP